MSCTTTVKVAVAVLGGIPSSIAKILTYRQQTVFNFYHDYLIIIDNVIIYINLLIYIDIFIIYLMSRSLFAVETSLYRHSAVLVDEELPLSIGASVDRIGDLALSTLVRISGPERFQAATYASVLRDGSLDIGFLELWLIVIDISQFHNYPRIGHVVLVIIVVFALKMYLLISSNHDYEEIILFNIFS